MDTNFIPTPFISEATDALIERNLARAFATRKMLGTTFDIVLERDDAETGAPVSLPAQHVLFSLASREPSPQRANAASYMGADGQLEKEWPFNVRKGDRFRVPGTFAGERGPAAVVTIVLPARGGVVRALFTLQG
jgi:hypothetical protein